MNVDSIIMTSTKYEVEKFTSLNDFKLWRLKMWWKKPQARPNYKSHG